MVFLQVPSTNHRKTTRLLRVSARGRRYKSDGNERAGRGKQVATCESVVHSEIGILGSAPPTQLLAPLLPPPFHLQLRGRQSVAAQQHRHSTTQVENGVRQETPKKDDKKSKDEQEATEFACDVEEGTGQCPSAHNKQIHSPFGHVEEGRGRLNTSQPIRTSVRARLTLGPC